MCVYDFLGCRRALLHLCSGSCPEGFQHYAVSTANQHAGRACHCKPVCRGRHSQSNPNDTCGNTQGTSVAHMGCHSQTRIFTIKFMTVPTTPCKERRERRKHPLPFVKVIIPTPMHISLFSPYCLHPSPSLLSSHFLPPLQSPSKIKVIIDHEFPQCFCFDTGCEPAGMCWKPSSESV